MDKNTNPKKVLKVHTDLQEESAVRICAAIISNHELCYKLHRQAQEEGISFYDLVAQEAIKFQTSIHQCRI
jgi:hypothetical protein